MYAPIVLYRDKLKKDEKDKGVLNMSNIPDIKELAEESGKSEEQIKSEIEMLEWEYGISGKSYVKKGMYLLPPDELEKKAINIRLKRRFIRKTMEATGWTRQQTIDDMKEVKDKYGIVASVYFNKGYYKHSGEERDEFHEKRVSRNEKVLDRREDIVQQIAEEQNITEDEAREILREARKLNITAKQFVERGYFDKSSAAIVRQTRRKDNRKAAVERGLEQIVEETGKAKEVVRHEIARIGDRFPQAKMNAKKYYKYGFYAFCDNGSASGSVGDTGSSASGSIADFDGSASGSATDAEMDKVLETDEFKSRIDKLEELTGIRRKVTSEEVKAKDVDERYHELMKDLLSELKKKQIMEKIDHLKDLDTSKMSIDDIIIDIQVAIDLYGFSAPEAVMYRIWEKSPDEKDSYVTDKFRNKTLNVINTPKGIELLDDKYETYKLLSKYYGREMILVDYSKDGYRKFRDFCRGKKSFVKKDDFDSLGRGVEKVELKDGVGLKDVFDDMMHGIKVLVIEELIHQNKFMADLNKDSVNTVRMVTYRNRKGEFSLTYCFVRIGRPGSFVDNAGAGGFFADVDTRTGVLTTDGVDEYGHKWETHPDQGYKFKGLQIPDWDKAVETVKAISADIYDRVKYVGWDMAYDENGNWIMVEGNSKPQYVSQAALGRGCKKEYLDGIGEDYLALKDEQ